MNKNASGNGYISTITYFQLFMRYFYDRGNNTLVNKHDDERNAWSVCFYFFHVTKLALNLKKIF